MELKKKMVAVCDLLGFSNLVEGKGLKDIIDGDIGYLRKILFRCLHQEDIPENAPTLNELCDQERVGFAWFSDTIIFYGIHDSYESNLRVIEAVGWLIFHSMFKAEIRIRAGISYGELFVDPKNSIYIGQAIVDAHRLEKKQLWVGGALTDSASENTYPDNPWLVPYEVPLRTKNGSRTTKDMMAINWTFGIHDPNAFNLKWSVSEDEPSLDYSKENPDIVEKWLNTKNFHKAVCQFCK